jgi:peroxiredoxin
MLLETPICDFGWKAPDFTLKDPDGASFTMRNYLGDKGLLIAFICNHCPYVKAIAEKFVQDANILIGEGIHVLAVMSNDYRSFGEDSPENMKKFAAHYGFPFPYLVDEDQAVGKAYDTVCTPDFFGLNSDGELQYRGRLDDARARGKVRKTAELLDAMRMIAETGQGPEQQIPSIGCSIKWR